MAHPISRTLNFQRALFLRKACASFHQINDTFLHPISEENMILYFIEIIWTAVLVRRASYLCQHTVMGQIDQFLICFRLWKTFYSLEKLKLFPDSHLSYQNIMLYEGSRAATNMLKVKNIFVWCSLIPDWGQSPRLSRINPKFVSVLNPPTKTSPLSIS